MDNRTIAAIATGNSVGSISVIRVSGADSVKICDNIFSRKGELLNAPSHTVHYGHIVDGKGNYVDEVLVSVFLAPKTYTRENIVEISTHGGMIASANVMKLLLENGAYQAEAGEFTKRAFLNGRIDLSQAEAVIDIINAKTTLEQKNALSQSRGSLGEKINEIREKLINLCASIQVIIDYPDEDLEDVTTEDIIETLKNAKLKCEKLLATSENGKIIKNGIRTVICGSPNVGKSSLLNFLSEDNRAIVTEIAGTTRDIIEESVNIDGIALVLIDTAGIRNTDDVVEKIGVEKSLESIENADLILLVLDSSREIDNDEKQLLEKTKDKKRIILINKTDICDKKVLENLKNLSGKDAVEFSTKTGEGAKELFNRIKTMYNIEGLSDANSEIVTNLRHVSSLANARDSLCGAVSSLEGGMPVDIASIDINLAIDYLGQITGKTVSEDIVSAIFHGFCVGK